MSTPQLRAGPVRVRVPATSANLGPGFDALGLALARYDDVEAEVTASGLLVEVEGAGADVPKDETNLVVRAMRAGFAQLGAEPPGLRLRSVNDIPHSRGLGSSAAAIVAGLLLSRGLVADGQARLDAQALLELATELEGHPDNVAPCLAGGLTIAWCAPRAGAVRLSPHASVRPVALIPPFRASTEQARALLPAQVPHADAAFSAGRAALLVAALTTEPQLLLPATEDRLHQRYRAPAMPASTDLVATLRAAGLPAVISGAGPTVLVLARDEVEVRQAIEASPPDWQAAQLAVDLDGGRQVASR
ncbi:MAG TPA: homoserine kinase [Jatrophihabitantaceae bacterium]|jgi:homoserine kinase